MKLEILQTLARISLKSSNTHKHAAALVSGGKIMTFGVNSVSGSRTLHAEIAAIKAYAGMRGHYEKCILREQ